MNIPCGKVQDVCVCVRFATGAMTVNRRSPAWAARWCWNRALSVSSPAGLLLRAVVLVEFVFIWGLGDVRAWVRRRLFRCTFGVCGDGHRRRDPVLRANLVVVCLLSFFFPE